ncbi:hypothetical protein CJ030_MR5G010177 [Morella rubra]|uniref:DUF4216 domain-containing protein n=1 Tax=Morella rubra TaxID=262757 RepID=A0A6A1VLS6_9ROSI|nr:hypothetical protein CJ030_MR5G010177 [Morella rubra]
MSRTWFTEDPFILASQAVQVFYLKDTKKYAKGNWHVVESVTARGYFPATQSLTNELDMSSNEEVSKNTEIVHEEVCLGGLPPIEATVQEHQQLRRDDISP